MIAALGETTGVNALQKQLQLMIATEEGQMILSDKPRINTLNVDLHNLRKMSENTFGYAYVKFLDDNVSMSILVLKCKRKVKIIYFTFFFLES